MKLRECKDWKAVVFADRTVLRKDCRFMSAGQIHDLYELEVEPLQMKGKKGYYKAK